MLADTEDPDLVTPEESSHLRQPHGSGRASGPLPPSTKGLPAVEKERSRPEKRTRNGVIRTRKGDRQQGSWEGGLERKTRTGPTWIVAYATVDLLKCAPFSFWEVKGDVSKGRTEATASHAQQMCSPSPQPHAITRQLEGQNTTAQLSSMRTHMQGWPTRRTCKWQASAVHLLCTTPAGCHREGR
eukprot:361013-Chlamydomonas_euryale.AAC.7